MRLMLVNVPFPCNTRHKKVLPLGLLYIASFLRRELKGLEVAVVDGQVSDMSEDDVLRSVLHWEPDVVGFGFWTLQAEMVYRISDRLRKKASGIRIIHGGVHPTIFPEEALQHSDVVVVREGELTMLELVRRMKEGGGFSGVRGTVHRNDGTIVFEQAREFVKDLDSLPLPAWDLVDIRKYDTQFHIHGGLRLPVIGSRGCPYSCSYCGSPLMWERRVRYRSPESVVGEIRSIKEQLHIDQIHFWDDNLFMKRSYIEKLLNLMVSEELNVRWTGLTRASHLKRNADLVPLARKAGCIGMEIGIESANPETFKQIHKNEDLETLLEVSEIQKANGMYPMFTYMAFNPGETIHGYYLQGKFIDRLHDGLPWADYFHPLPFPLYIGQMCTPHPGTALYREAHKYGFVLAKRWSDYYHHRVNFIPDSMLSDVPVKNMERLGIREFTILIAAVNAGIYSVFYRKRPHEILMVCLLIMHLSRVIFSEIDGTSSNKEVYNRVATILSMNKDVVYSYVPLITLVMAEMGWIKSAISQKEDVIPKVIKHHSFKKFKYRVGPVAFIYMIFDGLVNAVLKYGSASNLMPKNSRSERYRGHETLSKVLEKFQHILLSAVLRIQSKNNV